MAKSKGGIKRKRGRPRKEPIAPVQISVVEDALCRSDTGAHVIREDIIGKVVSDVFVNSRGVLVIELVTL